MSSGEDLSVPVSVQKREFGDRLMAQGVPGWILGIGESDRMGGDETRPGFLRNLAEELRPPASEKYE